MKPRIGISACLLGQTVRYDGGHKHAPALVDALAVRVELVPVCPEVGAGMSVPRPPLHVIGTPATPRLVAIESGDDWTDRMQRFIELELRRLGDLAVCGFVFKSRSPSCGTRDIPISGAGLFARAFAREFANLPVADETELADPDGRARFVERAVACARDRGIL